MSEAAPFNDSSPASAADEQIGRLLNEYLDRRKRGEAICTNVLKAEHPELASVLSEHLGLLRALTDGSDAIEELISKHVLSPACSADAAAELGSYQIQSTIGRGGMGIVLRAIERPLNRPVALKVLRPELAVDSRALVRFEHEAKAAAALRHPNIVTVYACGTLNGTHYLAMEAIDGPSLAERLAHQPLLSTDEIRRIFEELLLGLGAAHQTGLVHRDIKPSNMLLDGPHRQVKIADFGLARIMASTTRITLPQSAIGTPEYMSPEQARGDENVDHRSDLYSAGVVLYEMLTGRLPFQGESPSALLHAILNFDPPEPRSIRKDVDLRLARLAMRMMAKKPSDRFGTASDVLEALDGHRRVTLPAQYRRRIRTLAFGLGLAAAVTLVGAGAYSFFANERLRTSTLPIRRVSLRCSGQVCSPSKTLLARYGDDPVERVFLDLAVDSRFRVHDSQFYSAILLRDANLQTSSILATIDGPPGFRGLVAFDAKAQKQWSLDPPPHRAWPDCGSLDGWIGVDVKALDATGESVVFTERDKWEYPSRISIVDTAERRLVKSYYHIGQLQPPLVVPDFFGPHQPAIVAWGLNNKLDGFDDLSNNDVDPQTPYDYVPVVMILDPRRLDGIGPPRSSRFLDLLPSAPYAYAFIDLAGLRKNARRVPGTAEHRSVEIQETGTITKVELAAEALSTDPKKPLLNIHVGYVVADGEQEQAGTQIQVDRQLNILGIIPATAEKVRNKPEFWNSVWHSLIREYRDELRSPSPP